MRAAPDPAVAQLRASLPLGRVSTAEADLLAVAHDAWPRHLVRLAQGERAALPEAIVWPESSEEVQQVVVAARALGLTLVPLGAGSSVVGGATPGPGQVVLDLKRMQRVREIDVSARTATAEAGILGELFAQALARRGFTQGHFPSSMYCSTLGGWIAAKSAGQFSTRYGKIEDQVLGGVVVLGDGTLLSQRAAPVRSPEFDALIGAEGQLAVWTEATVRIHPLPEAQAWRGFDLRMERAVAALESVLTGGVTPSVVRLYDPLDSLLHRRGRSHGVSRTARLAARWPRTARFLAGLAPNRCRLVVGVEGEAQRVAAEMRHIVETVLREGGRDLGEEPGLAWYRRRYAISYEQSRAFRAGLLVDTMEVACTWDRVMSVYAAVRTAVRAAGALIAAHISHVYVEGAAIYFTLVFPLAWGTSAYDRVWRAALKAASEAGANVSHHHGTGRLKAEVLAQALGGATRTLAEVSQRFDPGRVLGVRAPPSPDATAGFVGSRADFAATAALAAVAPTQSVGAVEAELAKTGRTLGGAAQILGAWSVGDAARERLLWRYNPQLGMVESMVAGVDATVDGLPHRFVPAPRAAAGPELWADLLHAQVDRVWLRTAKRPAQSLAWQGDLDWILRLARRFARDAALVGVELSLTLDAGHAQLGATFAEGPLADLFATRLRTLAARLPRPWRVMPPPMQLGVQVAGSLASVWRLVWEAQAGGLSVALPWLDAFGAAGFVYDPAGPLDLDRQRRLTLLAEEVGAWPWVARRAATPFAAPTPSETVREVAAGGEPLTLSLATHAGALDHCTFCPKLCRVACPVAVAAGSETVTPRQLMLTANLARTGRRALAADLAARLWACVDCRGCTSLCEHGNDVATVLMEARAELGAQGYLPEVVRETLARLPTGAPRAEAWPGANVLFLCCENDPQDGEPADAALALARARYGEVRVLEGSAACCGHPLWRWGDRAAFARHAAQLAGRLAGAAVVVADEPGCAYALRTLYPEVGYVMPPVVTVADLVRGQGFKLHAQDMQAVHESCFSVRWLQAPALAPELGVAPTSMWEGSVGCCGGMLLPHYDAELARRVAEQHAAELLAQGARSIVTASPVCRRRLRAVTGAVEDLASLWMQARMK